MEVSRIVFESEKVKAVEVTSIYLISKSMVIFNIEQVEGIILDGKVAETQYLHFFNETGKINQSSIFEKDSFSFHGEIVNITDETAPEMSEKLQKFYNSVPGYNKEQLPMGDS